MSDRLDEIRARWAAATPGSWHWAHHGSWEVEANPNVLVADCGTEGRARADAHAIASAPADIAWLLEQVEAQRARVEFERSKRDFLERELAAYREKAARQMSHAVMTLGRCDRCGWPMATDGCAPGRCIAPDLRRVREEVWR